MTLASLVNNCQFDSTLAHDSKAGDTSSALYIAVARIVEYPSGSSSGEYMIASMPLAYTLFSLSIQLCAGS